MRKRQSLSQIKLSDAQKEKLKDEMKAFYLDVRGEELGMKSPLRNVQAILGGLTEAAGI